MADRHEPSFFPTTTSQQNLLYDLPSELADKVQDDALLPFPAGDDSYVDLHPFANLLAFESLRPYLARRRFNGKQCRVTNTSGLATITSLAGKETVASIGKVLLDLRHLPVPPHGHELDLSVLKALPSLKAVAVWGHKDCVHRPLTEEELGYLLLDLRVNVSFDYR